MTSDSLPPDDAHLLLLERNQALLHDMNARIARLAIALGVSLHNEQQIADAIHGLQTPQVALESFPTGDYDGVLCASNAFGGAHAAFLLTHA